MGGIMTRREKFLYLSLIFLICCFYFLRIICLEQDLAPWGVGYYQPADEGQYVLPAINQFNLGVANPESLEPYSSFVPYNLRTNLFGNMLTLWLMEHIGDNYYGFRMSSVIFGFLNLLLLYINLNFLKKIAGKKENRMANWAIAGILVFITVDFTFFNASIVVEPTIVRMLVAQILLLIVFLTRNHGCIRYFLLAFFSMLSIGIVYFTNLFFLLACGFLLLSQWRKEGTKKFIQYGIMFVVGMLAGGCLAEIYYVSVWNSHFLNDFFNAILSFSTSTGYQITGVSNLTAIPKSLIKAVAFYFSANPFFYCVPILSALLVLFPGILVCIFKNFDENVTFLFALPFSFLLQTLFSIDCITRKALIIYPIAICLIYYLALVYDVQCKEFLRNKCSKKIQGAYFGLSAAFLMGVICFRLFVVSDGSRLDFSFMDKVLVFGGGALTCFVVLLWNAYGFWRENEDMRGTRRFKKMYIMLCLLPFCVSPLMVVRHFVLDRTYTERDMLIEIGEVADNKYVVGAYVSGFTLYNNIKPITTILEEIPIYMQSDPDLLLLDYEDRTPGMRDYYDNVIFKGKDISAYPVYCGSREYLAFGARRGFYLFEAKPKYEIVRMWRDEIEASMKKLEEIGKIDEEIVKTLPTSEIIEYIAQIKMEQQAYTEEVDLYNPYPDITGTVYALPETEDVYVDVYGDVYNDVYFDIYGDLYGDIRGDIYGDIYGNVYGTVYGNVYGTIHGTVYGEIQGTNANEIIEAER